MKSTERKIAALLYRLSGVMPMKVLESITDRLEIEEVPASMAISSEITWRFVFDLCMRFDATEAVECVLREVQAERVAQDREWGGQPHDDQHDPHDWASFIEKQLNKIRHEASGSYEEQLAAARNRFVKIAALAVAAVEMIDRKKGASK